MKVDSHLIGQTDASGSFRAEVAVGTHAIELSKEGYTSAKFELKFVAGGAPVRPTAAQVAMTKTPASSPAGPTAPAVPKTVDTEPQDWARVANSQSTGTSTIIYADTLAARTRRMRNRTFASTTRRCSNRKPLPETRPIGMLWIKTTRPLYRILLPGVIATAAGIRRLAVSSIPSKGGKPPTPGGSQPTKKADQARAADIQAVKQTLTDFEAGYNQRDVTAIARIYSPVPQTIGARTPRYEIREPHLRLSSSLPVTNDRHGGVYPLQCIRC